MWRSLLTAGLVLLGAGQARSMQFKPTITDDNGVIITAIGPIIPGDFERLKALLNQLPSASHIIGFTLDSPGGNIREAIKLALTFQAAHVVTAVTSEEQCASSCFLLFAAGRVRMAGPSALIGVHSASYEGAETADALATTTMMARAAAELNVPPAILGKMVITDPDHITWLTPEDLALMDVRPLSDTPTRMATANPIAPTASVPSAQPPSLPLASSPNPDASVSPAFRDGLAARQQWEQWFAGLSGDAQAGAAFWAGQRSLPHPANCLLSPQASSWAWVNSCQEAQRRLAPSDARRKAEPDYRLGWNSYTG